MSKERIKYESLSVFFSDETERFRSPSEPDPGQNVRIMIRAPKTGQAVKIELVARVQPEIAVEKVPVKRIKMRPVPGEPGKLGKPGEMGKPEKTKERFSFFEASFVCPKDPVSYYFRIEYQGKTFICQKDGTKELSPDSSIDPHYSFRFRPGFHTPEWAKGAVQYQIFPDRFCNADPANDVQDAEYSYNYRHVRRISDWDRAPEEDDYRCFYGGDIAGILKKLDYLEDLGVEVIYLNPIFLSPSSHKYDTQDYEHIDPHFGVIADDVEHSLKDWEFHNGYARRYITRVLSKKNLELSDALFAKLCAELHKRNMKIILDGVFNHCGSFHRWMDREGIYREKAGYEKGAYQDEESPYREFFRFTDEKPGYEAWWDVETLPKLNYERSRRLWDTIFAVAEKWLSPPYSIDGWRLDVAADLGHSLALNHSFWKEFRERVKAVDPQALIIAEHYGDPADWLKGDEWDSVMNYSAFMEPVTYFLTGMEKHSDGIRDDLYQDGVKFFETMNEYMASFQYGSLQCAMNELSNHDHSRFLTRTNRIVGRLKSLGAEAADKGIDKSVMRLAVLIQMTWPGAPTIYYGDEAGLTGWTDPDNRRCYPWGNEDEELIEFHRQLIMLRKRYPVIKTGSLIPLGAGKGWIAYSRFDKDVRLAVICNNSDEERELSLDAKAAEAREGERFVQIFSCGKDEQADEQSADYLHDKLYKKPDEQPDEQSGEKKIVGTVKDGRLSIRIRPKSAVILVNE